MPNALQYKTFALTGADTRPRVDMERTIKDNGGSVCDAAQIRRYRPNYILVGYRPGNTKLNAGDAIGASFIIEEDFWKMIEVPGFTPRSLTRDQAIIYATTLTNKGAQTQQTKTYLSQIFGGVAPIAAATAAAPKKTVVSGDFDDLADDMSDFFGDD